MNRYAVIVIGFGVAVFLVADSDGGFPGTAGFAGYLLGAAMGWICGQLAASEDRADDDGEGGNTT